ncbi:MAG: MFS transporter [candidate division Zixibacteria bacterium]|nr:MFS transporter [candidate division Zixibacteria bacterium]
MRTDLAFYIAAFLMDMCAGLIAFSVPLLALDLGASAIELGVIGTSGSVAYTLGCLFTGKLADRHDRKTLMIIASAGIAGVLGLVMVVREVWMLAITTALISSMGALFWPALQAGLAEGHNRAQLVRVLGNFNMVWAIGFMNGPLLGGAFYEIHPRLPFAVGLIATAVIVALLTLIRIRPVHDVSNPELETPDPAHLREIPRFRNIAWMASFTAFFCLSMLTNQFPKLAKELVIAPSILGIMLALPRVVQFLIFMAARHTHRWQFRLYPLLVPQMVAVLGMTVVATQHSPVLLATAFCGVGLLIGSSFSAGQFYSFFHEKKKGEVGALNEMIIGMSNFSAPLVGGILAHTVGLRAPYILCIPVLCIGMVVEYRLARQNQNG